MSIFTPRHFRAVTDVAWLRTLFYSALFVRALLRAWTSPSLAFDARVDVGTAGHLQWRLNGRDMIDGPDAWFYGLGLLAPFLILQYVQRWRDVRLYVVLAVLLLSAVFTTRYFPRECVSQPVVLRGGGHCVYVLAGRRL